MLYEVITTCAATGAAVAPSVNKPPACLKTCPAQSAPNTAMPVVWPRVRVTANIPEAIPSRSRGAAPMMALLFGDWSYNFV